MQKIVRLKCLHEFTKKLNRTKKHFDLLLSVTCTPCRLKTCKRNSEPRNFFVRVWTWVNGVSGWTFLKSSSSGQYCSGKVQGWTENIKLLAEIVNPLPPTLPSKRATNRNLHILREQLTLLKTMWKQLIKRSTIFYAQFSSVSIVILQQI